MNRTYYQQMGYRIRQIRHNRGLSHAQLGKRMGLSGETIRTLETVGRTYLSDERMASIAETLGVTVENITADGWREQCGL